MEVDKESVLKNVLDPDELESLNSEVRKKLDRFYESRLGEYFTSKAISNTAQKNIDAIRSESEDRISDLTSKIQDWEAKVSVLQQNCTELRSQLDEARQEVIKLQENASRAESEVSEFRRDKRVAEEERDSLAKLADRRSIEVERLQADIVALEAQLQAASRAKCEALAKVHEIESKEVTLDFKEKRLEQEKQITSHQIQTLTEDLNRNISELQTIRRDNTMCKIQLESQLTEKTEELRIIRSSVAHLEDANAALQNKAEELTNKLHSQNEETSKVLNHYKKELHSKSKLMDMMKEAKQENEQQINEMATCITELKRLLNESAEKYGQLETRLKGIDIEHGKDLEEKDIIIQKLKDELVNANDLLKEAQEESLEQAVQQLAPTAAASSRLIKTGTSLTEIYSLYVKAAEEVQTLRKENSQLDLRIRSIIDEVEERAPQIRKQALENQKLEEVNAQLTNQLDTLVREGVDVKAEYDDMVMKLGHMEREYKKLKTSQSDLGLQVCFLLKEIEQMRGGFSSEVDQSISSDMPASEVISKKLVTFSNIQELQENNQKLLHVVRDLSAKLEDIEECEAQKESATFEAKLASMTTRMEELRFELNRKTQMLTISMQQKDRFQKMYSDLSKTLKSSDFNRTSFGFEGASASLNGDQISIDYDETVNNPQLVASQELVMVKDRRIVELEERLKDAQEQMKTIREEYNQSRKEQFANEKKLNEQFDSMRSEIRDLTASNCKLMATVEYNQEQLRLQQKNAATYKHQIQTLEEKNRSYEKIIVKHEHTDTLLRDEVLKVQSELSRLEMKAQSLGQENKILKDCEGRMRLEMESMHRERLNQNLLMNNLDMIKASFERSESEGKIRSEERLDQANRECSALRRRLQEEQDHFRVLSADLERKMATVNKTIKEEVAQADKLRAELIAAREIIQSKTLQIEDLSKKLQESLTPTKNDNPIAQAQKRIRELEMAAEDRVIEIESLQKELLSSKEHAQQYCKLSEAAEAEFKSLNEQFSSYKSTIEAELAKTKHNEETLKARVEDLETEISLQITKDRISEGDASSQLTRTQTELRDALQKLTESQRELRDSRDQIKTLTASLQAAEQKYSNEMVAHLNDIDSMSSQREELNRLREASQQLKEERDRAVESANAIKSEWETVEKRLRDEVDQLENRLCDHQTQNSILLDQIEALSSKLFVIEAQADQSMNDSIKTDNSLLHRSITGNEEKSSDELLQIVKYLRKEKDIAFAKVDVLKSETTRLNTEQIILQKKLDEAVAALNAERQKPEADIMTAAKHEDVLRKVETLNAMADSNRVLREERNALTAQIKEIQSRMTTIEDELYPLQEKNRELIQKQEKSQLEISALRTEAINWRQRANNLLEAKNRTNPEDFKRLQSEREGLAKMLTAEKELLRKANEEFVSLRSEKQRLDAELINVQRQLGASEEAGRKSQEDIQGIRASNQRLANELMEVKNTLLQKEDEMKRTSDELGQRDIQLADAKSKEIQIRKIAKRYKDSYMDLKAREEGKAATDGDSSTQSAVDLNVQLMSAQEENETLKRENEALKSNEHAMAQMNEATAKMNALLELTKAQKQTIEHNRSEAERNAKSLETVISRLEKEVAEEKENKEMISRLQRENESLSHRVSQLVRQLGIQQVVAKPSTSGGANASEKPAGESPRTANVKPMSSPSHQSATVTPWRASETPLASIRPMTQTRTAAVIPQASAQQSANFMAGQAGTSSSSLTTALVPPQQVHTTGSNSNSNASSSEASPTSSHTDYMPATSSATVVVAAIPPMASNAESTQQDPESGNSSTVTLPSQQILSQQEVQAQPGGSAQQQQPTVGQLGNAVPQAQQPAAVVVQQQTVALVSPRMETTGPNQHQPVPIQPQQEQAPSTSGSDSVSTPPNSGQQQQQQQQGTQQQVLMGTQSNSSSSSSTSHVHHHQASSSSSTVSTSQAGNKRTRDIEGDSSTNAQDSSPVEKQQPEPKRLRVQPAGSSNNDLFQGVSESGLDVEYQVPTSSQRESDFDIIVVDSDDDDDEEEDDDGMADEGTAEADDGPFEEDEADNGPDIDDNVPSDNNNEVEVDDRDEVPNQSGNNSNLGDPEERNNQSGSLDEAVDMSTQHQQPGVQQIQATSSDTASETGPSTTAVIATPSSQMWRNQMARQQATVNPNSQQLVLIAPTGYDAETGDDCIVPSTPNLLTPRRPDGFSEVVNSPVPLVPIHGPSRFPFNESTGVQQGPRSHVAGEENIENMEDTQIDLSQLNESRPTGRSVPNTPKLVASPLDADIAGSASSAPSADDNSTTNTEEAEDLVIHHHHHTQEGDPGPSSQPDVPEIRVTGVAANEAEDEADDIDVDEEETEADGLDHNASTPQQSEQTNKDCPPRASDPEEGTDGVSSEGEKPAVGGSDTGMEMEEGREAEATQSPTINTRSRAMSGQSSPPNRRGGRGMRSRNPIVWGDAGRGARGGNMNVNSNVTRQQQQMMMQQQPLFGMQQQPARGQRGRRMRGRAMGGNFHQRF